MSGLGDIARDAAKKLPRPVRTSLIGARKRYRSARYRARERANPTNLSQGDVEAALRECGVAENDSVFMQAAMSPFGSFADGPATVLDATRAVIGEQGLIAMPSYSLAAQAIDHLATDPLFDIVESPSKMGAISESFRRAPGTLRSMHPTHSTCVSGPGAEEVVAGHELAETPFGKGTPFPKVVERDALQVYFGCGIGALTLYHCFECTRVPPFPFDVFADRVFHARCRGPEGDESRVRTLVHNPAIHSIRIDSSERLQGVYREAVIAKGGKAVQLGRGEILAIRTSAYFELFEELIARGITIYDAPIPEPWPTVPPQERVRD